MKKVLLATSILAASAGFAAAETTVTGNARMGVVYTGGNASKLAFSSRVRADISMSSETDSGLAFGGSFGVHNAGAAAAGTSGSVFISGAFGKLEMGDTVSAAEAVVGDLPEIGFTDIANNDTGFITGDNNGVYSSGTGPQALYTYSTGALTFALSLNDGESAGAKADRAYSLGAKYAMDGYSFGIGYEVVNPIAAGANAKMLSLGGEATFGAATVKATYLDGSGAAAGYTEMGLGLTYKMDALTAKAMVKRVKNGTSTTFYGVGAEYALGGGATLAGGISDNNATGNNTVADIGLKFKF
jgi:outer membrane protein OmpU